MTSDNLRPHSRTVAAVSITTNNAATTNVITIATTATSVVADVMPTMLPDDRRKR